MHHSIRYVARFLMEADTPLAIGSGSKDLLTDSPVALDCNVLPMIPGPGICGVLRHALTRAFEGNTDQLNKLNDLFGYQNRDDGRGSRLVVSNAVLVGHDGQAVEGLNMVNDQDDFYRHFFALPVRQHCKINERGTAHKTGHGKFDNCVVFKGGRFVFELELSGNELDKPVWKKLLSTVRSPLFRVGGGTRKGYGALKTVSLQDDTYDLAKPDRLVAYLDRTSSLSGMTWNQMEHDPHPDFTHMGVTVYKLTLKPEDFILFGAGFGDHEVDMTPVCETILDWSGDSPEFKTQINFVPASSVKGAISHRTAFHYNLLTKVYADDQAVTIQDHTGENNAAVSSLFGTAKNKEMNSGQQGRVILSDVFLAAGNNKILNHVALDRFTQGPIDGALFSERVLEPDGFRLDILVDNTDLGETVITAFENALDDIVSGMLPLGGGVMRGHGVFTGTWEKEE